jgi:glutamyl-tRNA reductase
VTVAAAGFHARDVPVEIRERFLANTSASPAYGSVRISTCHRVEIYASSDEDALAGVPPDFRGAVTVWTQREAARHLFRLASGLDSIAQGEPQILRQLRDAYERTPRATLSPELSHLFQRALHVGRVARRDHGLDGTSLGVLATRLLARECGVLRGRSILVVGAGTMAALAANCLSHEGAVLLVANRDAARAARLAERLGGEAIPLERIADALDRADAVVSAADTRGTVLTAARIADRASRGPLVILDCAVPRSVLHPSDPTPGLRILDIDALDVVAQRDGTSPSVEDVERLCAAEADAFMAWVNARRAVPAIRALRARGDQARDRHLRRALARLGAVGDRERSVLTTMASGIVRELLHTPTVRGSVDPEALRRLFDLE